VDRAHWLLLFVDAAGRAPVDPVRIQKGMFLLAMSGALPAAERYRFEPYLYGPMSRDVYRDVRAFGERRLVDAHPVEGASWQVVGSTHAGRQLAAALRRRARAERPAALAEVASLRSRLDGLSFADLLGSIYDRYPAYASRSVFRRP
jgi:hypothetical protein